jgi:ketosteroid isomerase-like protein
MRVLIHGHILVDAPAACPPLRWPAMTDSPSAVVRRFFERYERVGIEGVIEGVAPGAALEVLPDTSAEPDVYEGREGLRRYFAGFDGALEDVRFELVDAQDIAPGAALGEVRMSGRAAATGIPVETTAFVVCLVSGGTIERMTAHGSRESALEALY